jgi:hypothetical protein
MIPLPPTKKELTLPSRFAEQNKRDLGAKPLAEVVAMLREEVVSKRVRAVSTATAVVESTGEI